MATTGAFGRRTSRQCHSANSDRMPKAAAFAPREKDAPGRLSWFIVAKLIINDNYILKVKHGHNDG